MVGSKYLRSEEWKMSEQEPIKIVIPVEEELPHKAEQSTSGASGTASAAGRRMAGLAKDAAQRAANSGAGRMATEKLRNVSDRGVRYVGTRMADTAEQQARQTMEAVQERVKQTDWEKEARTGLAAGLQWLGGRLNEMSERFSAPEVQEKDPADSNQPGQ
jgi:cell division septum initiation protein DivIVA